MNAHFVVHWGHILLALACAEGGNTAAGQDGISLYATIAAGDEVVDTQLDLIVVTVTKVSEHKATRGRPPVVEVAVDEALRAKKPEKKLSVLWEKPLDKESIRNAPDNPRLQKTPDVTIEKWMNEPVAAPKVRQRWILVGEPYQAMSKHAGKYWVFRKYPYTKAKYAWAMAQPARAKRLARERREYWSSWPAESYFTAKELLVDARKVTADTKLVPGQPLLWPAAKLWRCRVVEALDDGRVTFRPVQYDSRWDQTVARDKVLLYPKAALKEPVPLGKRHKHADIPRFAKAAKRIFVGRLLGSSRSASKTVDYSFVVSEIIKGEPAGVGTNGKVYVIVGFSRELGHLLDTRRGSYVLFLTERTDDNQGQPSVYYRIDSGDGILPADKETLESLKAIAVKDLDDSLE